MLEITYVKKILYPFSVVLDQYFDYEHIAHVHPHTLGQYRLIEKSDERIVYEQIWPRNWWGKRAASLVEQTFHPPGEIWFYFRSGKHAGIHVRSVLKPEIDSTIVTETYFMPGLPNWNWVKQLIRPFVIRQVDRVWEEDLQVGVCIGGWPGIPPCSTVKNSFDISLQPLPSGEYPLGSLKQFPLNQPIAFDLPIGTVTVVQTETGFRAFHPQCPHTGGPFSLGQIENHCIVCPWHGARFDMITGSPSSGPTQRSIPTYQVKVEHDQAYLIVVAGQARRMAV